MCLGTFSRRARSLATTYIFARVRIIGTLVPFCVIGNSKEFPITQKIVSEIRTIRIFRYFTDKSVAYVQIRPHYYTVFPAFPQ